MDIQYLSYRVAESNRNFFGRAWVSPTLVWSMGACASTNQPTTRPTVSVPFMWYWYVARAYAATPCAMLASSPGPTQKITPCHATVQCVMVIATRPRTESEKQRYPCNELRGWNKRETSESLYASASLSKSSSLAFSYVSFSCWSLHTNPFLQFST